MLLTALQLSACLGTIDVAIEVRGMVVDESAQPYENCIVSLYAPGRDGRLASRLLEGGRVAEWFTVSNVSKGIEVELKCEDSDSIYRSKAFETGDLNPVELGTVELQRRKS